MKVLFTPSGLAEHLKALEFLQEDNPTAAWRYLEHLDKLLKQLEQFPESGRSLPEYPGLPYREVIVHPNRYIYHVSGETVWIATVRGERQKMKKLHWPRLRGLRPCNAVSGLGREQGNRHHPGEDLRVRTPGRVGRSGKEKDRESEAHPRQGSKDG